jgi:hypothetical protein
MTNETKPNPECCPEFDPVKWDDKINVWEYKKFVHESVCTFFYMPLNFGRIMKKLNKIVGEAEAAVPDWMCLSEHTSKWNMDVYLAVDKELPIVRNIYISGKFYSKVYEGPFKDTGKWHKDFENIVKAKGYSFKQIYMWYTTCPKCAKKYGKNYVVLVANIGQ